MWVVDEWKPGNAQLFSLSSPYTKCCNLQSALDIEHIFIYWFMFKDLSGKFWSYRGHCMFIVPLPMNVVVLPTVWTKGWPGLSMPVWQIVSTLTPLVVDLKRIASHICLVRHNASQWWLLLMSGKSEMTITAEEHIFRWLNSPPPNLKTEIMETM